MQIDMSHIPNGSAGDWSITEFEVGHRELSQTLSALKTGRSVPQGKYKRLMRKSEIIMSNTPDEIRDFLPLVFNAHGNILINGLGLAVLVTALLQKREVTSITVIEASKDVISLVAPYITDKRVTIIHADAYAYEPPKGARYDFVWHDIWDAICSDNLPEMTRLHRKYAKRTNWQDSWAKPECQRLDRQWKRQCAY